MRVCRVRAAIKRVDSEMDLLSPSLSAQLID